MTSRHIDLTRARKADFRRRRARAQMRLEHRLDPRRARAAVEPGDGLLVLDEDERRDDVDLEALGELRARVDVDAADAQALPLLPLQVGEQALHPAGGARALGPEEHEQRPVVVVTGFSSSERGRTGRVLYVQKTPGRNAGRLYTDRRWATGTRSASRSGSAPRSACSSPGCSRRRRSAGSRPSCSAARPGRSSGSLIDDWTEVVAGAVGGLVGAAAAVIVVSGALRRGGTRGGLALIVAAVAARPGRRSPSCPCAGYLVAVALPVLALRLRRTQAERYAGLRTPCQGLTSKKLILDRDRRPDAVDAGGHARARRRARRWRCSPSTAATAARSRPSRR